ncbi:MAG: hypothetical protein PWQ88_258 [Candidatus Methanomethylophilaceae archaeon]|nr:hypothetical protein [Candidatus Methanomethylophilaceae archaeon]MDI3542057.1 hypothetical protein [Candidatus Methanomethylophilaceae archaeon]
MMKAASCHFVLTGDSDYKHLTNVFPDILSLLLKETDQFPEDEEVMQMFIELNVRDLERNIKPEGYNRRGRMRLIFPLDRKEFYIKGSSRPTDITRISEKISIMLEAAGVQHRLEYNTIGGDR